MTRQGIITKFDDKNLPILRNELQRLWDAIGKTQPSSVPVPTPVKVSSSSRTTILGGDGSTVAPVTHPPVAYTPLSGLTATAAFKSIFLQWINSTDPSVQYVEIWRSDTNDRTVATLIATSSDDTYSDLIGTVGTTKYYWIRTKNQDGSDGPWVPDGSTSGVSATTSAIQTPDVELFAITRGTQFYSAAAVHFDTATEVEIGTITIYTNETTDSTWLWASITILAWPNDGTGKVGCSPITVRIRRTTTTGTLVTTLPLPAYIAAPPINGIPVILQTTDIPGGSVGAHIYKLTACTDHTLGVDHIDGQIGYNSIMAMAKSR